VPRSRPRSPTLTQHAPHKRRASLLQHGPNSGKGPGPVPVIYFALLLIAQHVIGFANLHESRLRPWSARGFSVIPSTLLCDMPAHLLKLLSSLRRLVWVLICTQCGSVKQKSSLCACASAAAAAPGLQGPHLGATSRQASCMPACASTSSSVGARCRRTRLALWRVRAEGRGVAGAHLLQCRVVRILGDAEDFIVVFPHCRAPGTEPSGEVVSRLTYKGKICSTPVRAAQGNNQVRTLAAALPFHTQLCAPINSAWFPPNKHAR